MRWRKEGNEEEGPGEEIGERYRPAVRGRKMRRHDLTQGKLLHFFKEDYLRRKFSLRRKEEKEAEARRKKKEEEENEDMMR